MKLDVQIEYSPVDKIIIHQLSKRTLKEFIHIHCTEKEEPPLWCDGLLLQPYHFAPIDQVIEERLNNILHYMEVVYTEMPKYQAKIQRDDQQFGQPVINMGDDPLFKELVKWIKSFEKA